MRLVDFFFLAEPDTQVRKDKYKESGAYSASKLEMVCSIFTF
jgi:hypothetical protein